MQMHRRGRDREGERACFRACVCALKNGEGGTCLVGYLVAQAREERRLRKSGFSTLCASEFRHIHCARLGVSHCADVCAHACVLYLRDLLRRCVTACVCVCFFYNMCDYYFHKGKFHILNILNQESIKMISVLFVPTSDIERSTGDVIISKVSQYNNTLSTSPRYNIY